MEELTFAEELAQLQDEVSSQLREGSEFWMMIVLARARIAKAKDENDEIAAARAAAEYGAVVKRWRRFLIVSLTQLALDPDGVGREFVRSWQKRLFGQSVASSSLALFAKPERSGGGRAANRSPGEDAENRLVRFYNTNKDKVKACVKKP